MEYRVLGKTGLNISRMGFGGIPIQKIDAEGTKVLMQKLKEEGVNYIDTARGYTVSEEYLGYALEGMREDFIIATKSMSRTKEAMAHDIETSLKNLRTNYIDLYQVHNPNLEQLMQVVAEGGGGNAYIEGVRIGGKTATSQTLPRGSGRYIASFVGFAPADDPKVIAIAIINNPQGQYYGGIIAAPIIRQLFENILPYLGIMDYNEEDIGGIPISGESGNAE